MHPIECGMLPVLDLDPVLRSTGLIRSVAVLTDETFQAKLAGFEEEVWSDLALLKGIDEDPLRSAA